MRPIRYSNRIKSLIKEEFDKIICEIFDKEISTKFEIIKSIKYSFNVITYRFNTNSNTSYDLEFFYTDVRGKETMSNNTLLYQHIIDMKPNETYNSVDLAITLTERIRNDDTHLDNYTTDTNKNESIEVMGRIQYLVKEFIKNNPDINIYIIGKSTKEGKLNMYKKLFTNIFSNDFIMIEGNHWGYDKGAIYFINNKIYQQH
jgi:hypothetical protein